MNSFGIIGVGLDPPEETCQQPRALAAVGRVPGAQQVKELGLAPSEVALTFWAGHFHPQWLLFLVEGRPRQEERLLVLAQFEQAPRSVQLSFKAPLAVSIMVSGRARNTASHSSSRNCW